VTDSQGRVINFNNTVLIMTSNIGSQYIVGGMNQAIGSKEDIYEAMRERVLEAARLHFRPEFMNRVDEYIVFQQLDVEQIEQIVRLQVSAHHGAGSTSGAAPPGSPRRTSRQGDRGLLSPGGAARCRR
jgi:ATP-dependent Clp protease ATP-binding subunit ClpA